MPNFNESNSIQQYICDLLQKNGWQYVESSQLPRQETEALVEDYLKGALIKLNPAIADKPDRADEVIYKLRAILQGVASDGLVRANEEFTAWLKGERSMPFGKGAQHVTINLIDFENVQNNHFVVTKEYTLIQKVNKRPDIVLLVNGIPLVVGETKTPVRPAISWVDGAKDIHEDYERNIPHLFVPTIFNFATEGKTYRYGTVRAPLTEWQSWLNSDGQDHSKLRNLKDTIIDMMKPDHLIDFLEHFTLYATDKKNRKIKIMCRHQQYSAANQIIDRVVENRIKKGLIWHFQGSGKSLLMLFASQKLRLHSQLKSPTVIIVVDRIDLDTQITSTFTAAEVPNTVPAETREDLQNFLKQDTRKIIITTIHKFGEAEGVLNERDNIIVLVDEAHRTQEGNLGMAMRQALPNAFFFGLTGTPISKRDRNTFATFGAEEDESGYMNRYSFQDSIRDGATLPLHFEPRLIEMHIDQDAIDEEVAKLTDELSELEKIEVTKRAGRMSTLVRSPERIDRIAEDVIEHFESNVEPNGFKAMLVCYDRFTCVQFKEAFDKLWAPEKTDVVMSVPSGDPPEWKKKYARKRDEEEKLLDYYRDPSSPLDVLIVTAKLLTGFDAPILQTIYLDKVLKDHTLLQAICRANRLYPDKTHGLIVDYIGVFDDVAKTLTYDEEGIRQAATGINKLKAELQPAVEACLKYFEGVDRTISGYEGLIEAQECLPSNEKRDEFAADFSYLAKLWEAISPDPMLQEFRTDYIWLSQVYESIKPSSGTGSLIWHSLGAKTLQIINENIHVEEIRDDLDTIVIDDDAVDTLLQNAKKPHRLIEIKIVKRLQKHAHDPKFRALGEKLEELKEKYEKNFYNSLEYLKELLKLAKEVLQAEKEVEPADERKKAQAALTELFEQTKTEKTHIIVEKIVSEIDKIVKVVRFDGWQETQAGAREVKKALRSTLMKFQLHKEQELFDKAYAYIEEYY